MKFRKKPVVIEAVQWKGYNTKDVWSFMAPDDRPTYIPASAGFSANLIIPTLEGHMKANIGDWIIKGVKGEFYPCKPDIFEATYDAVDESHEEDTHG